jgi:bacterioferritin-associated ferredoxin
VIVCHCERVGDTTVEAVIASGADSVDQVTRRCRAGGRCGSCWSTIEELLDDARRRPASPMSAVA